jgi:1-acyl-sn-glycerol-3-phosphate acyltransferase
MGSSSNKSTDSSTGPSKPRADTIRPEITRLPRYSTIRRIFRRVVAAIVHLFVWFSLDYEVSGLSNIPRHGPAIIVSNHLGDIDVLLGWAYSPRSDIEVIIKSEIRAIPVLGQLLDAYGVIWVHRGQPDRRAIRAAIQGLAEGRMIGIAPEGRESLIGGLEEGTHGASYLALKADVPLLPTTFTGTENAIFYNNLKKLRRTKVTMTVGPTFRLQAGPDQRTSMEAGTQRIMLTLADQLPPEYRGVYTNYMEQTHGG